MTADRPGRPTLPGQLADGTARLVTALLGFLLAVALMIGPIVWAAGMLNGNEVSFDGGPLRLVAHVVLAVVFGRIASRRSRGLPVIGAPVS